MIGAVVHNVVGGFVRPRASVRRIIDGGHGFDVALSMVLLAYLAQAIFVLFIPGARPDASGSLLALHLEAVTKSLIWFLLLSAVVYGAGRVFGGTGNWRETNLAMAWYLLVTSVVVPLAVPALIHLAEVVDAAKDGPVAPIEIPARPLAMFMVASGIMLWLFACYVAELHRFTRTWNVVAVILGLSAAASFVVMALVPPA